MFKHRCLRVLYLVSVCAFLAIWLGSSPAAANTDPLSAPTFQFGADIRPFFLPYNSSVLDIVPAYVARTQLSLIRCCNVDWSAVEQVEGVYNWNVRQQDYNYTVAETITKTLYLYQHGYTPIVGIVGAPDWAKQYQQSQPGYACSPLRFDPATYRKFALFVKTLVGKLAQAGVKRMYIQPWNEPDAAVGNVPFGGSCWAPTDTAAGFAEGGAAYATMLAYVRAAIQPSSVTDPQVSIIAAGLVFECGSLTDTSCGSYQFVAHMLGTEVDGRRGIDNIDALDYHAYAYWSSATDDRDWDTYSSYAPLGRVQGKLHIIRQLLSQYGAPHMPVVLGEGALIRGTCPTDACDQTFRDRQANYVVRMYARAAGNGLMGALWYTLGACSEPDTGGTRFGEMISICRATARVQPAFTTLTFLSNQLAGAIPAGRLTTPVGVEGYAFYTPSSGRVQHIYWTNEASRTETITLSSTPVSIYDYKQQAYPLTRALNVGFAPLIVELPPGTFALFLPYVGAR